jgi:ribonuclease-3
MLEPLLDINQVELILGISFHRRHLLEEALIHSSYLNEHPDYTGGSNERMEFLGDSVIGVVITHILFSMHPALQEGDLTSLRSSLVSRKALAIVARRMTLGEYLLLGQGEERNRGRLRDSNLAAVFEAVVAAIFLDQSLLKTRAFIERTMAPELEEASSGLVPKDPKSRLQELVQSRGMPGPNYKSVETTQIGLFTVEVTVGSCVASRGQGSKRVDAERAAAEAALKSIGDL